PLPRAARQPDRVALADGSTRSGADRSAARARARCQRTARRLARRRKANEPHARRAAPGELSTAGARSGRPSFRRGAGRPSIGVGRPAAGRNDTSHLAAGAAPRQRAAAGAATFRRHRLRQARWQGDRLCLRPRSGFSVRRPRRYGRRTLREARTAHGVVAVDHDLFGATLRNRPAPAPRWRRRPDRRLIRWFRTIPARTRLDLGTSGPHSGPLLRGCYRAGRTLGGNTPRNP